MKSQAEGKVTQVFFCDLFVFLLARIRWDPVIRHVRAHGVVKVKG